MASSHPIPNGAHIVTMRQDPGLVGRDFPTQSQGSSFQLTVLPVLSEGGSGNKLADSGADVCPETRTAEAPSNTRIAAVFTVAILMGAVFGLVMELSKVTNPSSIRGQFLFEKFLMLKMFLAAAALSAFSFGVLSLVKPVAFEAARKEFLGCGNDKGVPAVALGALLLGVGMALAGSCPGMVMIQIGSNVSNAWVTVLGGLSAALLYGALVPFAQGSIKKGSCKQAKAEDFSALQAVAFHKLSLALAVLLAAGVAVLEIFFPWDKELPPGIAPGRQALPPSAMGAVVGLLQVPCVLVLGDTLGSSSAYMTLVSTPTTFSAALASAVPQLAKFRSGLGNWWQVVYLLGAAVGAALAAGVTNTMGAAVGVPPADAFVGGFVMILGSRLASGCTSGHGLSGFALLAVHSIVAVPAMFAGGIATSFIYAAVDPRFRVV
jgi:uncharacterized membrane protein YedE/YeeE